MTDKVTGKHLERKAMLYIRQSSMHQVRHREEGKRLQYAMKARLQQLGWTSVEVVDEDQGQSGSSATDRSGFQRMVAEVCLGRVGAVAAREVSRFARNNRDWHQLVEMCSLVGTLLVDHEAIYDPRSCNDRLLLGVKGSLSEYELDLLRQRSHEARREKAARGELLLRAPVGYVKSEDKLEKEADRRVQAAISSVFEKFTELGSIRQTLLWFIEEGLELPARRQGPNGRETYWRRPGYPTVWRILTNPAYAGAYVYGRSCKSSVLSEGVLCEKRSSKPRSKWAVLILDRHEGYISWEQYERIQKLIGGNVMHKGGASPGAAKKGPALLAGLLRCRRCGRKLTVAYSGRNKAAPRYCCARGAIDHGDPRCISFGGKPADEAVSAAVLQVVKPAALDAARAAAGDGLAGRRRVAEALKLDLQAARYAAERVGRQFDATDPENRLVADELERRWNTALVKVQDLEARLVQEQREAIVMPDPAAIVGLSQDLPRVWRDPETDVRLKKRIVRSLVEEIVVDVDEEASELALIVHWKGGVHTELRARKRRRGTSSAHTSKGVVDAVRAFVRICSDQTIAGYLNRNGLLTGRGNRWTRELVRSLRSKRGIPRYCPERQEAEGWLNLTEASKFIGVSPPTLRKASLRGDLKGEHPLPHGPWVFNKSALEGAKLQVAGARTPLEAPAKEGSRQLKLHF